MFEYSLKRGIGLDILNVKTRNEFRLRTQRRATFLQHCSAHLDTIIANHNIDCIVSFPSSTVNGDNSWIKDELFPSVHCRFKLHLVRTKTIPKATGQAHRYSTRTSAL